MKTAQEFYNKIQSEKERLSELRAERKEALPHPIAAHNYIEVEKRDNVSISVLKCKSCGHINISWKAN